MNCLPLVLYLMLWLDSVLGSLHAPVNVSVISVNFHHVLHWDPGPGTPPGIQYMVFRRMEGKKRKTLNTTTTSLKLKLEKHSTYRLTVQASYNQTLSPESHEVIFTPYEDTKIGPPIVSLAGCGNCIQINMSLPEADRSSGITNIQEFFDATFRIQLFLRGENKAVDYCETRNKSYTINYLKSGMEYCVQVHTKINMNKNTEPSSWKCTFTSIVESRRDSTVLGAVAALVILVVGGLMTSMFCLYYTGFICKLKAALPRALITARSQSYILTPEGTIPDLVSIGSVMDKQRKCNNPLVPHLASGDQEEEEEEGMNVYMDRYAQLSSSESLSLGSGNELGNSKIAASGDCGSLTERLPAEVEVTEAEFEDEAKAEGAKDSFTPKEGQTGLQAQEEEVMKEEFDSSGNVNLFSVTLAALGVGEEEEEDTLTDFLKLSDLEQLLPTVPKQTLSNTDSQTELDDQTKDLRCADTSGCLKSSDDKTQHEEAQEEEDDNEDDSEFSGYMAHR